MSHDEISCRKLIVDYLADYEDGSMPEADRLDLEKHLSHCPPCVVFLKTLSGDGPDAPDAQAARDPSKPRPGRHGVRAHAVSGQGVTPAPRRGRERGMAGRVRAGLFGGLRLRRVGPSAGRIPARLGSRRGPALRRRAPRGVPASAPTFSRGIESSVPAAEDEFGPCATEVSEPRQVRKEAAIRRRHRAPQVNLSSSSAAGYPRRSILPNCLRSRPVASSDRLRYPDAPRASPQMAAPHLRGPGRPGGRRAHALQRDRRRARRAGLPADGTSRRREDLDRADARPGAQLRQGADGPPVRRVRVLPRDPGSGRVARRPRDGRRLEPQDRERPGADRDGALRPAARPLPDRDHRRSPHAHDRGLQRAPEDPRGAAAPRAVHPRLDRAPQDPRDDRFALPAVRLPRADGPRDRGAADEGGEGREDRRDAGGSASARRARPRAACATRSRFSTRRRPSPAGTVDEARLRRDPRARRLGAARGHVLGGRGRRPGRGDREPGAPDRGRRRPAARAHASSSSSCAGRCSRRPAPRATSRRRSRRGWRRSRGRCRTRTCCAPSR